MLLALSERMFFISFRYFFFQCISFSCFCFFFIISLFFAFPFFPGFLKCLLRNYLYHILNFPWGYLRRFGTWVMSILSYKNNLCSLSLSPLSPFLTLSLSSVFPLSLLSSSLSPLSHSRLSLSPSFSLPLPLFLFDPPLNLYQYFKISYYYFRFITTSNWPCCQWWLVAETSELI